MKVDILTDQSLLDLHKSLKLSRAHNLYCLYGRLCSNSPTLFTSKIGLIVLEFARAQGNITFEDSYAVDFITICVY